MHPRGIAVVLMLAAASHCAPGTNGANQKTVNSTRASPALSAEGFRQLELKLLQDAAVRGICKVETLAVPRKVDVYIDPSRQVRLPTIEGYEFRRIPMPNRIVALGMQMGSSTSRKTGCSSGTSGVHVRDNANPLNTGYITCYHVATDAGGCYSPKELSKDQLYPATCDLDGCDANKATTVGTVSRWSTLDTASTASNTVDAAFVVSPPGSVDIENRCGLCSSNSDPLDPVTVGCPVKKCGRTTDLTCGKVTGTECAIKVTYDSCVDVPFVKQIRVEGHPFSRGGDSGSVVYTDEGRIVGLLFSGSGSDIAFVTPMQAVLDELKVSIIPPTTCPVKPSCPCGDCVKDRLSCPGSPGDKTGPALAPFARP